MQRGRSLVRTLLDSGKISGFKDPRTVLLWPFWRRVLSAFPGVRIVPIALLRSPHEIAMSLFTRSEAGPATGPAWMSWRCISSNSRRSSKAGIIPCRESGSGAPTTLVTWNEPFEPAAWIGTRSRLSVSSMNPASITFRPWFPIGPNASTIPSVGLLLPAPDAEKNAVQLEADGRARDRLQLDRLRQSRAHADETAEALRRTQVTLDQETESLMLLERQLRLTEERLNQSVREANQVWAPYQELRAHLDRPRRPGAGSRPDGEA